MKKVIVCINRRSNPGQPSCAARGSEALASFLEQEIRLRGLTLTLERFMCLGRCEEGPNLKLVPGGKFLSHIDPEQPEAALQEIEAFARRQD